MPARRKPSASRRPHAPGDSPASPGFRDSGESSSVRIVGGTHRGRKLEFNGDPRVRPMKDRTREAVFNLLGPIVKGAYAIDLFGGTGVVGLESISRGAAGATFIECHVPTSKKIRANAEMLGVADRIMIMAGDAFRCVAQDMELVPPAYATLPWVVFCCPPYAFYAERLDEVRALVHRLRERAPADSRLVVEAAIPFDFAQLGDADWRVREYAPATVGICPMGSDSADE